MITADDITWTLGPIYSGECAYPAAASGAEAFTADDLVIEELANSEAAALAHVAELKHENSILRTMVSESLAILTRQTAHLESARARIRALQQENRPQSPAARQAA